MSDKANSCPYCGGELEYGCLLGNIASLNLFEYGLQWFAGEPTWSKNLMQLGEPIGKFEIGKGSYALGTHCKNCRKIMLDY
jgi:hypothetical protein